MTIKIDPHQVWCSREGGANKIQSPAKTQKRRQTDMKTVIRGQQKASIHDGTALHAQQTNETRSKQHRHSRNRRLRTHRGEFEGGVGLGLVDGGQTLDLHIEHRIEGQKTNVATAATRSQIKKSIDKQQARGSTLQHSTEGKRETAG